MTRVWIAGTYLSMVDLGPSSECPLCETVLESPSIPPSVGAGNTLSSVKLLELLELFVAKLRFLRYSPGRPGHLALVFRSSDEKGGVISLGEPASPFLTVCIGRNGG